MVYNPDISVAFGGLGMKDGGGGSGSDGDDGYIALYTVLPCMAILFVLLVSFLVLVSVWVRCYVLRKRELIWKGRSSNISHSRFQTPFLSTPNDLIASSKRQWFLFVISIMSKLLIKSPTPSGNQNHYK